MWWTFLYHFSGKESVIPKSTHKSTDLLLRWRGAPLISPHASSWPLPAVHRLHRGKHRKPGYWHEGHRFWEQCAWKVSSILRMMLGYLALHIVQQLSTCCSELLFCSLFAQEAHGCCTSRATATTLSLRLTACALSSAPLKPPVR